MPARIAAAATALCTPSAKRGLRKRGSGHLRGGLLKFQARIGSIAQALIASFSRQRRSKRRSAAEIELGAQPIRLGPQDCRDGVVATRPENGGPASISYSTQPNAQRSVR